jgi:hypothetical protein
MKIKDARIKTRTLEGTELENSILIHSILADSKLVNSADVGLKMWVCISRYQISTYLFGRITQFTNISCAD